MSEANVASEVEAIKARREELRKLLVSQAPYQPNDLVLISYQGRSREVFVAYTNVSVRKGEFVYGFRDVTPSGKPSSYVLHCYRAGDGKIIKLIRKAE
ncbi:MAG: hypothetical protein M1378_00150 [Bacteroidetes bacterium]|nr:hypothetical protein [Bacteroidota bacterium]